MSTFRKFLNWYSRLSPARGKSPPPYEHVVQIGDPILRKVSTPVPQNLINSDEMHILIKKLHYVLNKYGSVGMSAPQIGVNMRVFVMRMTSKQISNLSPDLTRVKGIGTIPFTVYINPKLRVIDYKKVVFNEGCESIRGFSADVPRYKEVEVTGYNENGEVHSRIYKDWSARIVQHEIDHLDGKLYTDIMDRKTLQCTCWEEVNLSNGKVVVPFSPD